MQTARKHARARAAQRSAQSSRSWPQVVALDEWKAAFRAVEALKRLTGDARWLRAVRVFHSEVTGELELEAQVTWGCGGVCLPAHIDDVTVRVRCVAPGEEARP
jgi:hypothetical protein